MSKEFPGISLNDKIDEEVRDFWKTSSNYPWLFCDILLIRSGITYDDLKKIASSTKYSLEDLEEIIADLYIEEKVNASRSERETSVSMTGIRNLLK